MKGLLAYQIHTAYNLHFGSSPYDCVKYNFKVKAGEDAFKKSRYKWQYVGLEQRAEHLKYMMFLVFEENRFSHIPPHRLFNRARTMYGASPEQYIDTTFAVELEHLTAKYDAGTTLFDIGDLYPNVYHEYKDGSISFMTFMILNAFISDVINNDSRDIIAWPKFVAHCHSIMPFIKLFFDKRHVESTFARRYLQVV